MKNIHVLPTDNPSRLYKNISEELSFTSIEFTQQKNSFNVNQNIYITNSEKIKEGDWFMSDFNSFPIHNIKELSEREGTLGWKQEDLKNNLKIILTTDQDLIEYGVQAIDDEFLEWFVKNPSCEEVEVVPLRKSSGYYDEKDIWHWDFLAYKIIIPKEEPKQFKNK